jgi:hypothetical protein
MQRKVAACALLSCAWATLALGQSYFPQNREEKLALMIPRLFGPEGLELPNAFHRAHFENQKIQQSFTPVNTAIGNQIATLPFVSPGAGFVYNFNPGAGVYTRATDSFGPVLTERAETIGRRKLYLGFSYQYFSFENVDGIDLDEFPGILRHEQATGAAYEQDTIATVSSIDLKMNQYTAVATFGITNRFDVSAAIPIITSRLGLVSSATIDRVAPPSAQFGQSHFFDANSPNTSTSAVYAMNRSATGIGDVSFRLKWNVYRGERAALALLGDVRVPTGDERDFLGTGGPGVRPFIAFSYSTPRISPHVNIGYQWNGKSVLAGDVNTGTKGNLPDAFTYAAGADIAATRRITFAADFIGQHVIHALRVVPTTYTDPLGHTLPETNIERTGLDLLSGAVGAKINLAHTLLLTGNVIFRLNDAGLTAPVVPLIGLSWTF